MNHCPPWHCRQRVGPGWINKRFPVTVPFARPTLLSHQQSRRKQAFFSHHLLSVARPLARVLATVGWFLAQGNGHVLAIVTRFWAFRVVASVRDVVAGKPHGCRICRRRRGLRLFGSGVLQGCRAYGAGADGFHIGTLIQVEVEAGRRDARSPAARGGACAPRKHGRMPLAPQAQRYMRGTPAHRDLTPGQWPGGAGPDGIGIPRLRHEIWG